MKPASDSKRTCRIGNGIFFSAFISCLALIGGCVWDPSTQNSNFEGNKAFAAGRFGDARSHYEVSLRLATEAGDAEYAATAMYGLARANAKLCNVAEAEKWFRNSIAARESLSDSRDAHISQNFLEFARFQLAQGNVEEAVRLMDRAAPHLESPVVTHQDPIAYADFWDGYAAALKQVGRVTDAAAASAVADGLRSQFPNRKALFRPTTYPDCRGGK